MRHFVERVLTSHRTDSPAKNENVHTVRNKSQGDGGLGWLTFVGQISASQVHSDVWENNPVSQFPPHRPYRETARHCCFTSTFPPLPLPPTYPPYFGALISANVQSPRQQQRKESDQPRPPAVAPMDTPETKPAASAAVPPLATSQALSSAAAIGAAAKMTSTPKPTVGAAAVGMSLPAAVRKPGEVGAGQGTGAETLGRGLTKAGGAVKIVTPEQRVHNALRTVLRVSEPPFCLHDVLLMLFCVL